MKNILKNKKNIILLVILILAAFLRLYRIGDYITFLGDEGRDAIIVKEIVNGFGSLLQGNFQNAQQQLTLLGPTASVGGFFHGPIYYYFMAPFLWAFNFEPVGPAVMVALFGIFTVYLVYKIGKEFFGEKTALIAALLYSISPVVIAYSRSSWNPNLMPPFTLLTLYVLYRGIKNGRLKLFFFSGILFGILIQLHYIATFVGVIVFLYILLETFLIPVLREKLQLFSSIIITIKRYLIFFVGFIVGWSPFLGFEIRHGFPNIQSIYNFIFQSKETGASGNFLDIIFQVFFRLFGRLITTFPETQHISFFSPFWIDVWYLFTLGLGVISFVFFVRLWYLSRNDSIESQKFNLIFLWFIVGVILFGFYRKSIYDYYFQFLFPLPFLFVGYVISRGIDFSHKKNYLQLISVLAIGICALLVVLNLQVSPIRFPANKQVLQTKTIAEFVLKIAEGKPFNFALITGGNSDHAYRYFFKTEGQDPVAIENEVVDPKRKTVTDQLIVVCESLPCAPLGNSLWEVAGFGRAEIAGKWKVSVVEIYKLVPYQEKTKK